LEKLVCFIAIAVSLKLNVSRILTPKIRRLNQRFLNEAHLKILEIKFHLIKIFPFIN
ncbi:MAG: hypothetical protein ACI8WM_000406, partial [Burkholderiaceae bacterium]